MITQTQVTIFKGCLQLCRDHYPAPVSVPPLPKRGCTKYAKNSSKSDTAQVDSVTSVTSFVTSFVTPYVTPLVTLSATPCKSVRQVVSGGSYVSDFSVESQALALLQQTPMAGCQRFLMHVCRTLRASKRMSRWLRLGYRLRFTTLGEMQTELFSRLRVLPLLSFVIRILIRCRVLMTWSTLCSLNNFVIEPAPMHDECLYNIVFLRPMANGAWRMILDISDLNKCLVVKTFTMNTATVIRHFVG